jgi:hypothetical protein
VIRRPTVWGAAVAAAIAIALAAGAASASAAQTFGADLTQVTHSGASDSCGMTGAPCGFIGRVTTAGASEPTSPSSGVLTAVRVRTTGAALTLTVRVLRDTGTADTYLNVGPQISVPVTADATADGHLTGVTGLRHLIQAGDHLGIGFTNPATYFVASAFSGSSACSFLAADHPPDTNATYNPAGCGGREPLVGGTVEADADHDGFGDESQDQCPSNASTQGPCPTTTPAPTPAPTPTPKKKCKKKKKKHRSVPASAAKKKCKKHKK